MLFPHNRMTASDLTEQEYQRKYDEFLQRLRQARLDAGLTQQEVAARLGKSQSFVSRSENGQRRVDVVELQAFAEIYGKWLGDFAPL